MLPSLSELAGLVILAFLFAAVIAWLVREPRSGSSHAPFWSPAAASILMPLFALGLLGLPYLPWVSDWIPALRLLAGPGRALVWVIVLGQVATLVGLAKAPGLAAAGRFVEGPFAASVAIALVSLGVYFWSLSRLSEAEAANWPPLIVAAAIAALIWVWSLVVSASKAAATFAWAAVCLTAPFVLNSQALLPAAVVDLYGLIRGLRAASLRALASGGPGLLVDQEFGILVYAPVLLVGFVGLVAMGFDRSRRTLSAALIAGVLILIALAGSHDPWWSESMPGRTLLLLLPLLGPPIAWLYAQTHGRHLLRAGMHLLLLVSLGMVLVIAFNASQVPFPQEGDGSSSLLIWMSPTWQLWDESPTYVGGMTTAAVIQTMLWLAGFAIAGWMFFRTPAAPGGPASLFASATAVATVIAVTSTSAMLPIDPTRRRFDPEGRVLFPMLETFNTVVRPRALKYDPLSVVSPSELPPLFSLSAVPGQRRSRQPLRVVLNTRVRLPAGEYELAITGSDEAGTVPRASLGLQIGREGRPLETWPLALKPGGISQHRFRVPLDAEFVGFRASRQVERTIGELRLRPLAIVDEQRRFESPTVRSSAAFGPVQVFFHDGNAFPEAEGFWVEGRNTTIVTILKPSEDRTSLPLAIHSGRRSNAATLATRDWSDRIELIPGRMSQITIPSTAGDPFVRLSVTSSEGFIPAEVEAGSKDRRVLGVWIAFIPDDTAKTSEGR
jgi:hypothetical protein